MIERTAWDVGKGKVSLFYKNWSGKGCLCKSMLLEEIQDGISLKDALEKDFIIELLHLSQIEELKLLAGGISFTDWVDVKI